MSRASIKGTIRKIRNGDRHNARSGIWLKLKLLKTLVQRDLESKYKGSVLGNLWPVLNQLAMLLIYTYVFSIVLRVKANMAELPGGQIGFGMWLFAGLLPWGAFMNGFLQASESVVNQSNLVKKVVFPLTLLPLVPICSGFIESLLGFVLLIVVVGIGANALHATLWLFPFILLTHFLFTAGLGYLVAALTVFLRDIPQSLRVLISLWFYLTPIVYPPDLIPEPWKDWVLAFNPMAAIVQIYRDIILVGRIQHGMEWGVTTLVAVVLFYVGLNLYRRLSPAFSDVL